MIDPSKKSLTEEEETVLLQGLEERFLAHPYRHESLEWEKIAKALSKETLLALYWMEETGGEPDVLVLEEGIAFVDCSKETPEGRRSVCYDEEALEKRKKFKPETSAQEMASQMGISLLPFSIYQQLQAVEKVDLKTSSWLETDSDIRALGGALFGDRRYDHVFVYHNGADSYYKVRGFRAYLLLDI